MVLMRYSTAYAKVVYLTERNTTDAPVTFVQKRRASGRSVMRNS